MTVAQKALAVIGAIGVITALTLPGRQTPQVIKAGQGLFQGTLHTAETGQD
jgi:hypothetical protein